MASDTITLRNDVTNTDTAYVNTSGTTSVTVTDDAFGVIQAITDSIGELTKAIQALTSRLHG